MVPQPRKPQAQGWKGQGRALAWGRGTQASVSHFRPWDCRAIKCHCFKPPTREPCAAAGKPNSMAF